MHRFIPLLFLLAACTDDPLDVKLVEVDNVNFDDGLTEVAFDQDAVSSGPQELLPAHGDLTLRLSFRAEPGAEATLNIQGKYPLTLPDLEVAAAEPRMPVDATTGVWHDLELVFKEETATTPPILPAVYLDGNLVYYQQELTPTTDPAGPLTYSVTAGEIELADLRQAPVAGRSSGVDADGMAELNIPLLRYEYYELEDGTTDVRNWAQLTPVKTGYINRFDLAAIRDRGTGYAIRFFGTLEVPLEGEYTFRTFTPTTSRFYVDGDELLQVPGMPAGREDTQAIRLSAGEHAIRLDYIQKGGWNKLDLAYIPPGGEEERFLNTMENNKTIATPSAAKPVALAPDDRPYLLRSFLYYPSPKVYEETTKRTHVISVGEGEGPHYSLDLQTGALLQVWRGGFADVHDMWVGRGEPQVMRPLGPARVFDGSPQWALSATTAWPAPAAAPDEDDFRHLEYELDADGRPTFLYDFADRMLSDKIVPAGAGLLRELTNTGPSLYTQLAAAAEITEIAPGEFALRSPGARIKIQSYDGSGLTLQRSGGRQRLIAEVPTAGHIRYRIDW